jgi:serine protease Do
MNPRMHSAFALMALMAASAAMAQDTVHPRSATNRSIYVRASGGSYLGIGVAEIDAERAKALNLKEVHGVEVKSVDDSSPAAKAGLKEGDVVLEYNGQRIEGTEQFVRLVHETPVDRQVRLVVWRNGASENLTATIGKRPGMAWQTDDGDLTVEIPPVPPVPPMPPMPEMPNVQVFPQGRTPMLGIESESLTSQLAEFFGVKEGVLVRSVVRSSAADKAGIHAGDVIVRVDNETVTSPREITSALRAARDKKTVAVVVVRDKKEVTLNVTLESSGGNRMRSVRTAARARWS